MQKRKACQILRKFIVAVDKADVATAALETPRTPRQWVMYFKAIQKCFVRSGVPCLQARGNGCKKEKYIFAFTARGVMISRMAGDDIAELRKVTDCSLAEFASSFPDSKQHFSTLRDPRATAVTLKSFMVRDQRHKGPWHLWSMVACFCSHKMFNSVDASWMQSNKGLLKRTRLEMKRQEGQNPVPARLLESSLCIVRARKSPILKFNRSHSVL